MTWPVCVFLCRGRVVYQLTLSLWRLLCQCYCAEARLEVLKLTKHIEEGTIKARWRMRGLPLYSLLLRFYQKDKSHLYRYCKVHLDWSWSWHKSVVRLSLRREKPWPNMQYMKWLYFQCIFSSIYDLSSVVGLTMHSPLFILEGMGLFTVTKLKR